MCVSDYPDGFEFEDQVPCFPLTFLPHSDANPAQGAAGEVYTALTLPLTLQGIDTAHHKESLLYTKWLRGPFRHTHAHAHSHTCAQEWMLVPPLQISITERSCYYRRRSTRCTSYHLCEVFEGEKHDLVNAWETIIAFPK